MSDWWTALLPVVTLLIGSALTFVGTGYLDTRRDERALERAKAEREAAREEAISERREAFELTHLLDVHTALRRLQRLLPVIYEPDTRRQPIRDATEEAAQLNGLVIDDQLRDGVFAAINKTWEILLGMQRGGDRAPSVDDLLQGRIRLGEACEELSERIRSIYKGSVTSS